MATLEAFTGISLESRPPCGLRRDGFRCRYTRLTPSTTTLLSDRRTRSTFPRVPLSSPAITSTTSSLRRCMTHSRLAANASDHLGGEAEDLVELRPQFAGHRAEDAGA